MKLRHLAGKALQALVVFGGVLLCGVVILGVLPIFVPKQLPFQSRAEAERIRDELPSAQDRWEQSSYSEYMITVLGSVYPSCIVPPTILHVKDGAIVRAESVETHVEHKVTEGDFCYLKELLPPKGFATIEQRIEQIDFDTDLLRVTFDTEYGFIVRYDFQPLSRNVSPGVQFEFADFKPISP